MGNFVLGIWIAIAICAAFLVPEVQDLRATPIAFFHVPMAITMFGCFFASAGFGAHWLWKRNPKSDALSFAWGEVGFVVGCITFGTGLLFARVNWNAYWTGDPQQVGVLGTLMLYAAMLTLRGAIDDDTKKRNFWAVYALIGVLVACFGSYVYSRIVPQNTSLHPNNTLRESSQLYKTVFLFNIVGYFLVMARVATVRARLENATARLRELAWN